LAGFVPEDVMVDPEIVAPVIVDPAVKSPDKVTFPVEVFNVNFPVVDPPL